ncbi:MAG: glutamate--tRNA ligase [Bacteroidota bacterium]|nr:glutamate--tRNA ligase [Candidatus Kapabacteria bacterium]MDW8220531.1 glutamate--tRNA ligase [Bacteroidota bacterium]
MTCTALGLSDTVVVMVRVRFAPSPTGYLHVGGLRTALYNYLFAKHHGGVCILRIEDTDRTRFVEGAAEALIEILRWAGIEFDESPEKGGAYGPYVQSERFDLYRHYAAELVQRGAAYYAFDTPEELEAMRKRMQDAGIAWRYDRTSMRNQYTLGEAETHRLLESNAPRTIRMKVPLSGTIRFDDLVRGTIEVPARDVDDQILLKSDNFPTYHLANIVDDHLMRITHVIRGEEWLPSTPKHVLLYDAMGWERPAFAHLPLLLNPDKTKLSKRQGDVAVEDYRQKGYFREALINFVALLGWNPSSNREIFSMQELIEHFDLTKVNKAGAVFDIQKLEWMNSEYLRAKPLDELARELLPTLQEQGINPSLEYLARVIGLVRERIHKLCDVPSFAAYMFSAPAEYEPAYKAQYWRPDYAAPMQALTERLAELTPWSASILQETVKAFTKESGLKIGILMNLLRLTITGRSVGAGMPETMELLGKDECIRRITTALQQFSLES